MNAASRQYDYDFLEAFVLFDILYTVHGVPSFEYSEFTRIVSRVSATHSTNSCLSVMRACRPGMQNIT